MVQRDRSWRDGVMNSGGDSDVETTTAAAAVQTTPGMPVAFFPSLAAHPLDRLGFCRWVLGSTVNLGVRAPCGPHLSFIAQCDRGPPTIVGWAPPIRARGGVRAGLCRWAKAQSEINTNILPLDLTLPFNFILYL